MKLIITVIHIMVCLTLVFVVLLQRSGSADMGSAFGGSSQSLFGARGSGSFMGKLTAALAGIFMLTSLTLAFFTSGKGKPTSVMEGAPAAQSQPASTTPKTDKSDALPIAPPVTGSDAKPMEEGKGSEPPATGSEKTPSADDSLPKVPKENTTP